jgi:uncharacterized protein DUF3775
MTELDINRDTLEFIIDKAHEFHAKEGVSIPEESLSPADDWALQMLADHQDDPTYAEFVSTIEDLGPDQRVALVALMWCGRGDFDAATEWEEAMAEALAGANSRTADYLLASPLLADYLQKGLEQIDTSEDADQTTE